MFSIVLGGKTRYIKATLNDGIPNYCASRALTNFRDLGEEYAYNAAFPLVNRNNLWERLVTYGTPKRGVIFLGDCRGGVADEVIFPNVPLNEWLSHPAYHGFEVKFELSEYYTNANTERDCRHMTITTRHKGGK